MTGSVRNAFVRNAQLVCPPRHCDSVFDCLNVLYQIAVRVTVLKNGTFRFLVTFGNNFLVFKDFADPRKFPYTATPLMNGDFEILVDVPKLFVSMNEEVNRGL